MRNSCDDSCDCHDRPKELAFDPTKPGGAVSVAGKAEESMTWGEFKAWVDAQPGVTDDLLVGVLDIAAAAPEALHLTVSTGELQIDDLGDWACS